MTARRSNEVSDLDDPPAAKKRKLKLKVYDNPWKAAKGEGKVKYVDIKRKGKETIPPSSQKPGCAGLCSVSPRCLAVNHSSKKTKISKLELVNLVSSQPSQSDEVSKSPIQGIDIDLAKRENSHSETLVSLDSNKSSNTPNMTVVSLVSAAKSQNTPTEGMNRSNSSNSLTKYDPDRERTRDSWEIGHLNRRRGRKRKELQLIKPQNFRHFVRGGSLKWTTPSQKNVPQLLTVLSSATPATEECTPQPVAKTDIKDINEKLMADRLMLVEKRAKQRQKRLRASKNKQQLSRRKLLPEPPMNFFLNSDEDEKSRCLSGRHRQKKQKSEYGSSIFSSNYKILQEIGSGEFGTVYKVVSRWDGCIYAVKELKKMSNPLKRRSREMLCMSAIKSQGSCDNLVEYFGGWAEENIVYIAMEYCERGSLEALSRNSPKFTFSWSIIQKIFRHIAAGLAHMHFMHLVHMDVKPANMLVSIDWKIKLCDFGHCIKLSEESGRPLGTVHDGDNRYRSYEVLSQNYSDLSKSDIYSLGASVYELARGKALPARGKELINLRKGKFDPVKGYPDDLNKLLLDCMAFKPSERPSAAILYKNLVETAVEEENKTRESKESQNLESVLKSRSRELERLKIEILKLKEKNRALKEKFNTLVQHCKQDDSKKQFIHCKSFNER